MLTRMYKRIAKKLAIDAPHSHRDSQVPYRQKISRWKISTAKNICRQKFFSLAKKFRHFLLTSNFCRRILFHRLSIGITLGLEKLVLEMQ